MNADRASLFLLDTKTNQLYARIFDISAESVDQETLPNSDKEIRSTTNLELSHMIIVRFPRGTGIAGHVADTGETLNVADVEMVSEGMQ